MKYQNFAIIFVIIVLPLSMVLSYYIQNQTDTLVLQTTYQTKLNDSTYDAIAAYQINSLNTQRVAGESIKSYVLASVNTFFTTLATNFGMSSASKTKLQNYVPAILFTTYDGYYIYSPTKMPQVAINIEDGVTVTTKEKDVVYAEKNSNEDKYRVDNSTATQISKSKSSNLPGGFTIDSNDAKIEYNYMVKPFVYYSAQYTSNNYNVIASYTLDNYVTVYGQNQNIVDSPELPNDTNKTIFTKSGYLIDPEKIQVDGDILVKFLARDKNENKATSLSKADVTKYADIDERNRNSSSPQYNNVRYFSVDAQSTEAYNYINYYEYGNTDSKLKTYDVKNYFPNKVVKKDSSGNALQAPVRLQTGDQIIEDTIQLNKALNETPDYKNTLLGNSNYREITVKYNNVDITNDEAKEYYIKAYFFSLWVKNNLSNIVASSMEESYLKLEGMSDETKLAYTDFSEDQTKIFDISSENDPESEASAYSQHKYNVIKNSIQYNLNSAISTFNDTYGKNASISYRMPILKEDDWKNVLNNVTMVTFLQGLPCGTNKFNSYSVVKSNNNNTSVNIENMYFVKKDEYNTENANYHMYDCPELGNDGANDYIADQSAEFKYDAKRIVTKVKDTSQSGLDNIVCLYDDSSNTYYEVKIVDGEIKFGDVIPNDQISNYNNYNLSELANGSEEVYLYDHKNLGCYTCIISKNYAPVVKFYKGDLRRTFSTDDGKLIIEMDNNQYEDSDGNTYNGNVDTAQLISIEELNKRKSAVYTYLAKIRNSLYKTNSYVNR